jgi:hypothetical protein
LRWLPDTLEICSQIHEIDRHQVVLVHTRPGACSSTEAVRYDQPDKAAPKIVFQESGVFYHAGMQSTRLNQQALDMTTGYPHMPHSGWLIASAPTLGVVALRVVRRDTRSGSAAVR